MPKINTNHDVLDNNRFLELIDPSEVLINMGLKGSIMAAEVECGNGIFSLAAADLLSEDGKIYCFDSNEKDIHILKTKITNINIVPILSPQDQYPLKNKLLDFVVIAFKVNILNNISNTIKETRRVLKDDGKLCFIDWIKKPHKLNANKITPIDLTQLTSDLKNNQFIIERTEKLNESIILVIASKVDI